MRTAAAALQSLALLIAAAGCGHERVLVPGKSADVLPDAKSYATATEAAIRMSVTGERWDGRPEDLPNRLTPMKVRVRNASGVPVRISCESFSLVGKRGRTYRAIPPFPPAASDTAEPIRPVYTSSRFFVAAQYRGYYRSVQPWPRPLPASAAHDELYAKWPDDLPTHAIRRRALPDGVLDHGGVISGYVYFENATDREARVVFRADLTNARTGAEVASFEIPFDVE